MDRTPLVEGKRVNVLLTKENYAYVQEWKLAFEYTVGQAVSTEIAINALIGAMRKRNERGKEKGEKEIA